MSTGDTGTSVPDTCMAAVPTGRSYTARLDDIFPGPIAWAECGEPAVAVHVYRCGHGHEKRRATCPAHAPEPGQVGCRDCYDAGHECAMTASPAEGIASNE